MKVTVDLEVCTGHGRCYSLDPDMFEADDEGFGRSLGDEVEPSRARAAVRSCPEHAIRISRETAQTQGVSA